MKWYLSAFISSTVGAIALGVGYLRISPSVSAQTMMIAQQTAPKTAVQWYNQGVDQLAEADYKGAIKSFSESIQLNPQDPDTYYNRGYAEHILGNYDAAIKDYNQAIALKPKFAYAFGNRCYAFYILKDYQKAIADC
ncbi:MAG: tetratricopeptide repeat protein, partial [Snowella sp.]